MKGIDLSNYALEDLLSFDDIFLDYFNNFLKNPAFPQSVQYNRFLSVFEEILPLTNSIVNSDRLPKRATGLNSTDHGTSFSTNEAEQNKIFDWVRKERLPLFFRTNLFREFKLCKLLVRPLDDDRRDSVASSQLIGGYSRQSPPNSSTLSTEAAEDRLSDGAADEQNDDNALSPSMYYPHLDKLNKYLFQRPGSRAFSVPAYFPFFTSNKMIMRKSSKKTEKRAPTASIESSVKDSPKLTLNIKQVINNDKSDLKRQDSVEDLRKIDNKSSKQKIKELINGNDETKKSSKSKQNSQKQNNFVVPYGGDDYDDDDDDIDDDDDDDDDDEYVANYDQNKIGYNDEFDIDGDNSNDINNIGKNNNDQLSIDDVIDDLIDSDKVHASINQYKSKFLGSVRGMNEFREFLKETTNGDRFLKYWLDCEFYRDSMQDYDQIENMATRNRLFRDINEKYNFPFANKVNEKIKENLNDQYGLNHQVFERIQYDILRRLRTYWVPRFILNRLRNNGKNYGSYPLPPLTPEYSRQSTYNTVPSTVKAVFTNKTKPIEKDTILTEVQKKILFGKVKEALFVDKDAGGPFLRFISIHYPDFLPLVLFWYDVIDFNESYTNKNDKNSRMQHAWAIYNSYLSPTSRFNIGSPSHISEKIRKILQSFSSSNTYLDVDVNLFQEITENLVQFLELPWLEFIKDDVMKYTEARLAQLEVSRGSDDTENIPEKIPAPDVEIDERGITISRPWVHRFLLGKSVSELSMIKQKPILTPEQKAARARKLKIQEIERRKALKAAKLRLKLKRLGTTFDETLIIPEVNDANEITSMDQSSVDKHSRHASSFRSDKSVFFDKMLATNKSMMQLLRKFLVDTNQRDALNKFNFYLDVKQYQDLNEFNKKQLAGITMQKTYLDPNSKRNVLPLSEKLQAKLQSDLHSENRGNARPRTPFMLAANREFRPILEEQYQIFCELQAKELGLTTAEDFATLSQAELLVLLGDTYNAKDFDFDDEKGEGKQMPSKEDRAEFLKLMLDWAMGKYDGRFYAYFAHLTEHGKKDGLPFLEKDLLFCIDSLRIKEINGEEVLKQKCQVILDVYLDSQIPPAIQVDITHEIHQKLIKTLAKVMQGSHTSSDFVVFDDAKAVLFKDLLPYWSGFKHSYKANEQRAITKTEKLLKERLDEFMTIQDIPPIVDFKLPPISARRKDPHHNNTLHIAFSLTTGIKFKDDRAIALNSVLNNIPTTANNNNNGQPGSS